MTELEIYIKEQIDWSTRTFGSGMRTLGLTTHIQKELEEIKKEPHNLEEWIDVIILALEGAWRAGYSPNEITNALWGKQDININRKWGPNLGEDHPIEHIREK